MAYQEEKEEFKKRIYNFVLRLIKFIDSLPNDRERYEHWRQLF